MLSLLVKAAYAVHGVDIERGKDNREGNREENSGRGTELLSEILRMNANEK